MATPFLHPLLRSLSSPPTPQLSFPFPYKPSNPKPTFPSPISKSLQNPLAYHQNKTTLLPISQSEPYSPHTNPKTVYDNCVKLLRLSVRNKDVQLLKAVHTLALRMFNDDSDLFGCLISAYLKLGFLSHSWHVFRSIENPSVFCYNTMITGLVTFGYEVRAIRLFNKMRDSGIEPNEYSFVAVLSACRKLFYLRFGIRLHSLVVKYGCDLNVYVATALMGMYENCGCFGMLEKVFDEMPVRDVVAWNTVISGAVHEMMYEKAFDLVREMQRVDKFRVDDLTILSVLTACSGCCAGRLGREMHAHALRLGFEGEVTVNNGLIGFYTKCGGVKDVKAVFERMPTKDVVSWNSLVTAYMEFGMVDSAMEAFTKMPARNSGSFNAFLDGLCKNGQSLEAISLFRKMVIHGVELTERSLTSVISACSLLAEKSISEQIHGFVVKFGYSDAHIEAALLDMCAKCDRMTDAHMMLSRSQYDRDSSMRWTSMIIEYARNAQPEKAISLFHRGHAAEEMVIDDALATAVLGICGTLGFNALGQQMHCYSLKSGFFRGVNVGNAVISMYAKCDYIEEAVKVFDLLPVYDVVSWNSLISGHLLQRKGDEALAVWSRLKRTPIRPDAITLDFVILSYRHTRLDMLDECRKLFFSMKEVYGIEPDSKHYASFISVLGAWGSIEEAEAIVDNMPFEPNTSVLRALLHSCSIHADSETGRRVAKRILDTQPQDPSTFILVANIYAASGLWHLSDMVREEMQWKGLQKYPVRCWFVQHNKVHSFYGRDQSHPQSKDIYRGLQILILECLKAGYVPDTSFVLQEVEECQKKEFLFYHSAKLAVAYGLLMTRTRRPIRVTKNVILCGDCHNFFKYVSEVSQREICVRDTSGFHHFSGGQCSCEDLW